MNPRILVAAAAACLTTASAWALSAGDQYNLDQLKSGSPSAIRGAAKNVFNAGNADRQVLDVMAELLANPPQSGDTMLDAQAWICKALANTPDSGRYYTVVSDAAKLNNKLEKHCGKAAEQIGSAKGDQYAKGSASTSGGGSHAAAAPPAQTPPPGGYKPITAVVVGMSMDEAYSIAGQPTSTGGHVTGKAFNPFGSGKGSYLTVAHYKGQGRVIFANSSRYHGGMEVSAVEVDPGESGYQ